MANILQVTPPGIQTENRAAGGLEAERQIQSQEVQNPSVPEKVNRADGRQEGKAGTATQEGRAAAVQYESNYGAFVKGLAESQENQGALRQLLLNMMEPSVKWAQKLGDGMAEAFILANGQEAAETLKEQASIQTRFSGPFFDDLRSFLIAHEGQVPQEAEAFLKAYADYSAGPHLLRQMHTLSNDIEHLMLRQSGGEWKELAEGMDWAAPRGETQANTQMLNGRLIPFLASYISRTHDYGGVRNAVMLFIFHAVRYENGSLEQLEGAFVRLAQLLKAEGFLPEEPEEALQKLTSGLEPGRAGQMADQVSRELFKAHDSPEGLSQTQDMARGLLVNESVFMPLVHLIFPFRIGEQEVASEMWIDPDAERKPEEGRKVKLLLKFDIRRLGSFEMVMSLQERQAGVRLYVPASLMEARQSIGEGIEEILKNNGLNPRGVQVGLKKRENQIEDVFPEIRRKERIVNVRI